MSRVHEQAGGPERGRKCVDAPSPECAQRAESVRCNARDAGGGRGDDRIGRVERLLHLESRGLAGVTTNFEGECPGSGLVRPGLAGLQRVPPGERGAERPGDVQGGRGVAVDGHGRHGLVQRMVSWEGGWSWWANCGWDLYVVLCADVARKVLGTDRSGSRVYIPQGDLPWVFGISGIEYHAAGAYAIYMGKA